jgi:hypothetical protein
MSEIINQDYINLLTEVKQRVLTARYSAVRVVNRELVVLTAEDSKTKSVDAFYILYILCGIM